MLAVLTETYCNKVNRTISFHQNFRTVGKIIFQSEEYLTKQGEIQIYKIMRKSHKRSVSMNLRFMQKYINVHTFIFISLKYHIHYTHACFFSLFHAYLCF